MKGERVMMASPDLWVREFESEGTCDAFFAIFDDQVLAAFRATWEIRGTQEN